MQVDQISMELANWDSVLQFANIDLLSEPSVSPHMQVPTPPVRLNRLSFYRVSPSFQDF